MGKNYQQKDFYIIDYSLYKLQNLDVDLRGPKPKNLSNRNYIVCIGAAQTFGRFCLKPFPELLQSKLNIPVINLGISGTGPYRFMKDQSILDVINGALFVIVQVLSGRSESNSLIDTDGKGSYIDPINNKTYRTRYFYEKLISNNEITFVKEIINETRVNWINSYKTLFKKITVPKLLFWFSQRPPHYNEEYTNVKKLLGQYPHLVNQKMVENIKKYCNEYIECVSNRGFPHLLINRFTGKPATVLTTEGGLKTTDKYYPSPEMHEDAVVSLIKTCQKYC